jgi:hypothetical protein
MLDALKIIANENDQLKEGLLALNERVNKLELALVEADQALLQATGQHREGARH